MANIMLTNQCNLRCSYCFASDIISTPPNHIDLETYIEILDFIIKDNPNRGVGLIGGEPLLHPMFEQIIELTERRVDLSNVTLFTNGLNLEKYLEIIKDKPLNILINYSAVIKMESTIKDHLFTNIVKLNDFYKRVTIGLTIEETDDDYMEVFDYIKKYKLKYLRLSCAVPNNIESQRYDIIPYYYAIKEKMLDIVVKALELGVMPVYDCNQLPICLVTNNERNKLKKMFGDKKLTNVLSINSSCTPVIDIMQDKTAIRCFGCSSMERVNMTDFKTIIELHDYFKTKIDNRLKYDYSSDLCSSCNHFEKEICSGGCFSFKSAIY